jgi:AhpD family alkylhydroperoxidase
LTIHEPNREFKMTTYRIHTIESAPEKSKPSLEGLQQAFGLVPNLAATMADSPVLINSFVAAFGNLHGGSLTGAQRQAILLTNAVTNACAWAVAFHSTLALKEGISADDVRAIRARRLPADARYAPVSALARALNEKRGHLDDADVKAFLAAGFSQDQVFEVIAGVAISVMANYAGNVANPPLEAPFQPQAWSR